ncbi:MAG: tol-pal system YbgF family protein [bacterium]
MKRPGEQRTAVAGILLSVLLVLVPAVAGLANDKQTKYSDYLAALENLENKKFAKIIIEEASEYLHRFPDADNLDDIHLKIATIYHDNGDEVKSFFTHMEIIYFYPGSEVTITARDRIRAILVKEKKFKLIADGIDRLLHPVTQDSTKEAAFYTFLRDMNELRFKHIRKPLLASLQQFLTTFPNSARADAVLFWRAELLLEEKQTHAALADFLKLTYLYDTSLYVTASKLEMAELFSEKLKNHHKAILALEEFLLEYPDDPQAPQAQFQIAQINEKRKKKYLEAINAYTAVAEHYPESSEAVPALFEAARLYEEKFKEYDQAIRVYTDVVRRFPEDLKAPYAFAEVGRIYEKKLKEYSNAVLVYHKVYERYPQSAIAAQSLYAAAEISEKKLQDYDKAIEYYRLVVDKYSTNKLSEKAGKRIERLSKDLARE